MDKLNETIKRLSKELNEYHLPSEVDRAMSVAKDMDVLERARLIINANTQP